MRITYRGYQEKLIGSLASKYRRSPTELLLLLAKILEGDNSILTHEALDAQEKQHGRKEKELLYNEDPSQ